MRIFIVDNLGNGLCLFYSVSSFLGDVLPPGKSSIPNAWVPFIKLNNSTRFCKSKAALSLTQFLCTLSRADFDVLIQYFGFSDDEKPKQLPTKYNGNCHELPYSSYKPIILEKD
jgi:hypothetical protein